MSLAGLLGLCTNFDSLGNGSCFQIVIEGKTGSGIYGDIAIDDLDIRDGSCPQPGEKLLL